MERKGLVQRIRDQEIEYKDRKPEGLRDAAATASIRRIRTLVTQSGKPFSIRSAVSLCSQLLNDRELRDTVERICSEHHIPYREDILYDAIGEARAELLYGGTLPVIRYIRDIGGKKVEELLGSLLNEADQQGIDRHSLEPGYPREIVTTLGELAGLPPRYTNPEEEKSRNDEYQISDLLQRDALRELGLELDRL